MAGTARPAIPGNRHKDGQTESSDAQRSLTAIRQENAEPLACSAVTGRGVREIWQAIAKTHHKPVNTTPPQEKTEKPQALDSSGRPLGTLQQRRRLRPPKRSSARPNVRPNGPSVATREKAAADQTIVTEAIAATAEIRASAASTVAAAPSRRTVHPRSIWLN